MQSPQIVKVFLGSSITELKDERRDFSAIGADISNLFSHDEIVVQIVRCENFHAGHVGLHDQGNSEFNGVYPMRPPEFMSPKLMRCATF